MRLTLGLPRDKRIPRWRPLLGWLLVLPQLLVGTAATFLALAASAVRGGNPLPQRRFGRIVRLLECEARALAYAFFLSGSYPSWWNSERASPS